MNLITEIKTLLRGIDQTETESDDGWWETSTGAEFGKNKLNSIVELIAIDYVMSFYNKTEEEVRKLYMDEVEAYIRLVERMENE